MRTIKFSHHYYKIPFNFEHTYLLDVWALRKEALSRAFIDYDTKFETEEKKTNHYKLPNAKVYLVLMLYSDGELWTTVRAATKEKHDYYKSLIGQEVKIEVKK